MLHRGMVEPRSVTRVTVIQARSGRVTLEWTLDGAPTPEWVEAFDAASEQADFRRWVPSAYGRPLVVHEGVLIWSVAEDQVPAAMGLVERALAEAQQHLSGYRHPLGAAPWPAS